MFRYITYSSAHTQFTGVQTNKNARLTIGTVVDAYYIEFSFCIKSRSKITTVKALWHVAICIREQLFLRINKMNSRNWQVGKSPTWLYELDDLPTLHRLA